MTVLTATAQQKIQWAVEKIEVETGLRCKSIDVGDDDTFVYEVESHPQGFMICTLIFRVYSDGEIVLLQQERNVAEKLFQIAELEHPFKKY